MIRLAALWLVFLAALVFFIILREEKLASQGKVPLGRLRRLWFKAERRRAPRYRVNFEIRYRRLEGEQLVQAKTRDLSQTGVGLILEERLAPGMLVDLEFHLPNRTAPLEVTGKIAWSREVPHDHHTPPPKRLFFAGVQFHQMGPEKESILAKALQTRKTQ